MKANENVICLVGAITIMVLWVVTFHAVIWYYTAYYRLG